MEMELRTKKKWTSTEPPKSKDYELVLSHTKGFAKKSKFVWDLNKEKYIRKAELLEQKLKDYPYVLGTYTMKGTSVYGTKGTRTQVSWNSIQVERYGRVLSLPYTGDDCHPITFLRETGRENAYTTYYLLSLIHI